MTVAGIGGQVQAYPQVDTLLLPGIARAGRAGA